MDMRNKLIREIQKTDQTIERFRSLITSRFTGSPLSVYESISDQITELEENKDGDDMEFCIRTVGVSVVINWIHEAMLKLGEAEVKEKIIEELDDLTAEELDDIVDKVDKWKEGQEGEE